MSEHTVDEGAGRIFGLGLSRTGTTSLGAALRMLGFRTLHYPYDRETHAELAAGRYRPSVLGQCDAVVDITVAPFYAQLDAAFPGSRFILTLRDKQVWLASLQRHWEAMQEVMERDAQFRAFTEFICACTYGTLAFNADRMSFVYDQHVRSVREYFAGRDDLLVMDVCARDGWDRLCGFLDRPAPQRPFPHRNTGSPPAPAPHETAPKDGMTPGGSVQTGFSGSKTPISGPGGPESGPVASPASHPDSPPAPPEPDPDPNLALLVRRWPSLSAEVRAVIVQMVRVTHGDR